MNISKKNQYQTMDPKPLKARLYPEIRRGDSWYDVTIADEEDNKPKVVIEPENDEWQTVKNKRRKRRR
jgi:hypothetical protein